ncbi:hypothetical protein ACSFC1_00990 [Pseudothermotoga sp. U03pept]|uniref:hypothetical protein n=1 Tax=Pseudothermotoga sp. U03pept TaxID=3447012 RepID=UPI003F00E6CB
MKWYFFAMLVIVLLLFSCQQRSDITISLSVDPSAPTPDSTVTLRLSASFDVGITLAAISVDGKTVQNGDRLPLEYQWVPTEAKEYIIEGYVENIFGQKKTTQTVVTVLDKTAPVIDQIKVLPTFPEAGSSIYLSIDAQDKESRLIKAVAKVGSLSSQVQTIDNPIVIELPALEEGEYPLSIILSTSDFAKTATSTTLTVYPVDISAPTLEISYPKKFFSVEENVILKINAQDDTELSSISVECNGTVQYETQLSKTKSTQFSVNLGKFDPGLQAVVVTVKDVRGKSTVQGDYFAVGLGPASVRLTISNSNPSPADLVQLTAETEETLVKQISFYVDGVLMSQGTAFSYCWRAVSGRHTLAVLLETTDGRTGVDCIQIDVQDNKPPRIVSFKVGNAQLKTDEFTSIEAGYYGVRITISDDTAVKQGGTISVIVSSNEFPNVNPIKTIILVQESVSDDLKEASYVGATSLTQGRYYLLPSGIADIYENQSGNLQFLLEVR